MNTQYPTHAEDTFNNPDKNGRLVNPKRRSPMQFILYTILILLAIFIFGYGGAIAFHDPLVGKEAEMAVIETAFEQMDISEPTWQTVIIAASQETPLPREQVWATWSDLENWPTWSQPLHESGIERDSRTVSDLGQSKNLIIQSKLMTLLWLKA